MNIIILFLLIATVKIKSQSMHGVYRLLCPRTQALISMRLKLCGRGKESLVPIVCGLVNIPRISGNSILSV